jgi:hypothetical protein
MDTPLKAILWSPSLDQVGFCDRLRGIAAGAVFAKELGAKLFVKWDSCGPCPVDFLDVFQESDYFSTCRETEEFEVLHYWNYDINVLPLDLSRMLSDKKIPKELRVDLPDDLVMYRWAEILGALKPLPSISQKIEEIRNKTDPRRMLGVHLRRTDVLSDRWKEITRENVDQFDRVLWARIILAVEGGDLDHIYLASDDQTYFQVWRERLSELPVEIHYNTASWGAELRQTPLDDLLVDLYLLSSCRKVYGSIWSSVFLIGDALGGNFEIMFSPELLSPAVGSDREKLEGNPDDAVAGAEGDRKKFFDKDAGAECDYGLGELP